MLESKSFRLNFVCTNGFNKNVYMFIFIKYNFHLKMVRRCILMNDELEVAVKRKPFKVAIGMTFWCNQRYKSES